MVLANNILKALTFVAILAAAPAIAGQKAENIAITTEAKGAAVIVKSRYVPISYPYQTSFRLNISGYDPVEEKLKGGGVSLQAKEKLFYDGYLVADIKPGTYTFLDMSRQDRWALCFHDNSLQFTIKAGQVLYLGEFDSVKYIEELETNAIISGRVTSQNSEAVHFFDNITPPAFGTVTDENLAVVAAMMKARMPKTTVAPTLPSFSPARFGTGSDLFGLNRVCGGYFSKKAKPKDAAKTQ